MSIPLDEGFFGRIIDAVPSLITVHDGHQIVYASPSVEAMLGYQPGQLVGKRGIEIVHPEDAALVADAAARGRAGESVRVEVRVRHREGRWRWCEMAASALPDVAPTGQRYVVFGTTDITERRDAVELFVARETKMAELMRLEQRYRRLIEVANEGIIWVDAEGSINFTNARMAELIGYDSSELVGKHLTDLVHSDETAEVERRLAWVKAHGASRHERRFRHRDGSSIPALVNTAPVHDDEGTFLGTIGLVTDLTEQRAADRARRDSQLEIERLSMLAERERFEVELERSRRFASIGRLAGGIAHDFNNLLGVIGIYLRVVKAQLPAGAAVHDDVDQIDAAIERAARLTQELLLFGDRASVPDDVFDPDELLAQVAAYASDLLLPAIRLAHLPGPNPIRVRISRTNLDRCILNLLWNARDAMPTGGTVTMTTNVVHEHGVAYAAISVNDTGIGMEPSVAASAVDPFFSTKPSDLGTGLGLAIVNEMVAAAGGILRIESVAGRGTAVTLLLPAIS